MLSLQSLRHGSLWLSCLGFALSAHANTAAYRCKDAAGHMQYQQHPCAEGSQQQTVDHMDSRSKDQVSQAKHVATLEQDLARQMAHENRQQDRASKAVTMGARPLTVAAHPHASSQRQVTKVASVSPERIPRKRDFRAVSSPTVSRGKRLNKEGANALTSSPVSPTTATVQRL